MAAVARSAGGATAATDPPIRQTLRNPTLRGRRRQPESCRSKARLEDVRRRNSRSQTEARLARLQESQSSLVDDEPRVRVYLGCPEFDPLDSSDRQQASEEWFRSVCA